MPMKVKDLIALLETDGWFLVRTKGSHRVIGSFTTLQKPGTVTVSGKASVDVPPGTLNSALRQAGLKSEEVMDYVVIIEKGENSFGACVPDLPGCVAVGDTREEAMRLIREAIEFHLEGLRADGLPVPPPSSSIELVHVDA